MLLVEIFQHPSNGDGEQEEYGRRRRDGNRWSERMERMGKKEELTPKENNIMVAHGSYV